MSSRSSLLIIGGALAGCMLLAVCVFVAAGGYFLATQGNPLAAVSAPAVVNRIAYVGNDQNIYVADPVTGEKLKLTADGGPNHAYNYPTWSPDNRRLAFVGYTITNGDATEGTLYTVAPSGEKLTPVYQAPRNFPFYLYWSSDSQFIGFLANKDNQNIALHVAQSDHVDSMQEIDTGAPFYWAWAPDGSRLFTHVGGTRATSDSARLALLDVQSKNGKSLDALPGSFQAPQWTRAGKILFSTQEGTEQAIAISNAEGGDIKKLVTYQGRASFALSPDSSQVAYIVTDANMRLPHFGPLRVVSAEGGEPQVVSEDPALAFLWSPDSRKLAYLTVTVGENQSNFNWRGEPPPIASTRPERFTGAPHTDQGGQTVRLNWQVWDSIDKSKRLVATFIPTASFLNVIPYFDQYASSTTFWSPDSKSLVYTNGSSATTGEVWVADVNGAAPPHKIGDGTLAFWSWH